MDANVLRKCETCALSAAGWRCCCSGFAPRRRHCWCGDRSNQESIEPDPIDSSIDSSDSAATQDTDRNARKEHEQGSQAEFVDGRSRYHDCVGDIVVDGTVPHPRREDTGTERG